MSDFERNEYLRKATTEDSERLLSWRNDPSTRAASFQTGEISLEEHARWFSGMMEAPDVDQYIYVREGVPTGQTRVNLGGENAVISYSIARESRGRGLAGRMLSLLEDKVRADHPSVRALEARVKPENSPSRAVLEGLGYEIIDQTDQAVIYCKVLFSSQ